MGNTAKKTIVDTSLSIDELGAMRETRTRVVELGDGVGVVVRELDGYERFHVADYEYENRWEVIRWIAQKGLVEPELAHPDDIDKLPPEWIGKIANAVGDLSGINTTEEVEKKSEGNTDIGSV